MRALAAALLVAVAQPAAAQIDARTLATVAARPSPDVLLPATLAFGEADGAATTLGRIAGGRPLVLLFADYTCRHVCGPGVTLTAASLHASGLSAGTDYRLAIVGLDPRDGPATARAFAARIGDPDVARATHLLVGSPASVAAATRALGYRAVYDPATDQWAHDASVYVFGRDGRLAALLPELGAEPKALRAALAARPVEPGIADRIARLCYGLDAAHGRFGAPIGLALRTLAALTLLAGGALIWRRARA